MPAGYNEPVLKAFFCCGYMTLATHLDDRVTFITSAAEASKILGAISIRLPLLVGDVGGHGVRLVGVFDAHLEEKYNGMQ